ncbi:MAG: methionine adenosyltransferase [Lentimicrobiaceae bacterium]|jgi:S-adenosylmethionine synthetase|nr:methionine adenosyltransferase [Lentimicrobiaceae bacterium]MBT3454137.1 methionine adenosyltransferase [Lentimicrobiaceae bacterium]MBT3819329.1 methionine adenosyltransferase [Lentimicrobiaceae bacterium]MBT4061002.1 methionine adenosyltransferase [Lentimicrobiaceae bacterium]MBT4189916.1 methionine adenosyltransferase [Lentimicrobiaceae bacterium]
MSYFFTSESVSEGHPDKVSDQISDGVLDEMLRQDPDSKVACETLVTTGLAMIAGEVKSTAYVDLQKVARRVIERIGYTKAEYRFDADSCSVLSALHDQSADINQGVDRDSAEAQGAGDQGMMFGFANKEMDNYMPFTAGISHDLLYEMANIRREGKEMLYLRPDSKSQVTLEYDDDHNAIGIKTIVISTQHDDFASEQEMQKTIKSDVENILIPRVKKQYSDKVKALFNSEMEILVNPTGKFVIGGPHGDTGLTGRKIIVDTYGGHGAHGGGAFSGKDSSKVDRSAAYATRHIAKNLVAAGVADKVLVQVAYAIGVADPVGFFVDTYGTSNVDLNDGEIARNLENIFDMRPYAIVSRFGLKNPIFEKTAAYGHFGRSPYIKEVEVLYKSEDTSFKEKRNGIDIYSKDVEFFGWEKLDYVDKVKSAFGI